MKKTLLVGAIAMAMLSCSRSEPKTAIGADDASQIRRVLAQWARDFTARDPVAVCGLFAPDVVVIYQDQPNRDYAAICKQLTTVLTDPAQRVRYDEPRIDELVVSEGLAVVRLVWTLHVPTGTGGEHHLKENGVDVFRKQADGSWKIRVSHAFPEH